MTWSSGLVHLHTIDQYWARICASLATISHTGALCGWGRIGAVCVERGALIPRDVMFTARIVLSQSVSNFQEVPCFVSILQDLFHKPLSTLAYGQWTPCTQLLGHLLCLWPNSFEGTWKASGDLECSLILRLASDYNSNACNPVLMAEENRLSLASWVNIVWKADACKELLPYCLLWQTDASSSLGFLLWKFWSLP